MIDNYNMDKELEGDILTDAIHGQIRYPNYVYEIIDTEEFQRLRNIKQLGTTHFVYPSANHTRFEHSLGVCHLASQLLNNLEKNSNITIDPLHRKCVIIAGLLHDIGHGPYSHAWDLFVHTITGNEQWNHENISCEIVKKLFNGEGAGDVVGVGIRLSDDDAKHDYGVKLICALIIGGDSSEYPDEDAYLFEIINNKYSTIDVDKWDYILRDIFYLKNVILLPTDFTLLFQRAKLTKHLGKYHISYNCNDLPLIMELFNNRSKLHYYCYKSPKIEIIARMITDILISAETSGFLFNGIKMSQMHEHLNNYKYFDDTIIQMITTTTTTTNNNNNNKQFEMAKKLIKRLKTRKIYKTINVCTLEIQNPELISHNSDSTGLIVNIDDDVDDESQHKDSIHVSPNNGYTELIKKEVNQLLPVIGDVYSLPQQILLHNDENDDVQLKTNELNKENVIRKIIYCID